MVVCYLLLQADSEGPYPHLLRRLLRHTEARDPEKRAELMAFRQSRKNTQSRQVAPQDVKQGIDSTMQRFEAYKLKQELEQQQKIAEMEKARLATEAKKAIEIERQRQAKAELKKAMPSKSKGMERD